LWKKSRRTNSLTGLSKDKPSQSVLGNPTTQSGSWGPSPS
jgi:hypothetical protein